MFPEFESFENLTESFGLRILQQLEQGMSAQGAEPAPGPTPEVDIAPTGGSFFTGDIPEDVQRIQEWAMTKNVYNHEQHCYNSWVKVINEHGPLTPDTIVNLFQIFIDKVIGKVEAQLEQPQPA